MCDIIFNDKIECISFLMMEYALFLGGVSLYYINDKVKEKFEDEDFFDGKEYVKKIKDAIRTKDIKSIGVYGKWGIGKTSIIKNAISELIEENDYKENQIVEYNAWKYNEYDFMRDFLIVCSNKIEGKEKAKEREESYYSDSSEDRQLYIMLWKKLGTFIKKSWRVLLFLIIIYIISVIVILYINYLKPTLYDCADLLTPLTLTLISFILPLFLVSEITHKSISKKFSPEQFSRDFEEIVKDKNVLIFIDDIDRCSYVEIKSTFDTLKTFILDENYNVKFIIPVDPNILFNSLEDQTYDYFSKIIDFPIEIKNYTKVKFEPLKEEILKNVSDQYKEIANDGLYLASKFYIDTPRKMKKFANEFVNELYNHSPEEIKDKGYMFAKLIILKNEFPNYYYNLIRNYNTVIEITEDEIVNYKSRDYTESKKQKKGVVFSTRLLEFLSKTDNVDLYNFPIYENKISYSEYKIKALCEDPFIKNKFDDKLKINLKENIAYLDYEFSENVIKPIINNKFLYSDPLKRVCFLIVEFKKQINNDVFDEFFEKVVDNFEFLKQDRNLFISEKINENDTTYLNIKYILECLEDYFDLLQEQELNILEDKLIIKILDFIQNNIDDSFEYIQNELLLIIQKFNEIENIDNISLIKIIDKYLSENFEMYYKIFDWYLKFSSNSGKICFVSNIIKLIKNNVELDEELLENYLNNRYLVINTNTYFESVSKNINDILKNPNNYKCILKPLCDNLNGKDISFEQLEYVINTTKYVSDNEYINNFILKIVLEMRNSKELDENKYKEILKNIGNEYDKKDSITSSFKNFVEKCNDEDKYCILNYNDVSKKFENFNILKKYKIVFNNNNSSLFNIISNSYCEFEDYVIEADIERHNLKLSNYKKEIKNAIKDDINKTLYLTNDFTVEEINDINFEFMDISKIELEYIENKYLISKIANQLKSTIDTCINNIKLNKENTELIKEEVAKILLNANKLYVEIKYSDKTLWTKLKKINEYLALNELIDSFYIPKLNEYPDLIKLFSEGKYKDSFQKDNIFADKILIGIGIKKDE